MSASARRALIVAVAAIVCLGTGLAVAQDEPQPWIHVEITGDGAETENLNLNLPLSAARALLAMVPDDVILDGQLRLEDHGVPFSVSALRDVWQELMKVGDTEFVTIEQDDETVRVARAGDNIEIRVVRDSRIGTTTRPSTSSCRSPSSTRCSRVTATR